MHHRLEGVHILDDDRLAHRYDIIYSSARYEGYRAWRPGSDPYKGMLTIKRSDFHQIREQRVMGEVSSCP